MVDPIKFCGMLSYVYVAISISSTEFAIIWPGKNWTLWGKPTAATYIMCHDQISALDLSVQNKAIGK